MITFEEFKKMELKTGKIISVENHPNADRLYILKIDIGGEQKQSVAGLRPYFKPEELLNKTVVVVANLQPGNLRGVESQVMVLVVTVPLAGSSPKGTVTDEAGLPIPMAIGTQAGLPTESRSQASKNVVLLVPEKEVPSGCLIS
ncbi:MAG: hypothetical protein AAB019_11115 [Planctomycetota bacterium]